ncbi:hypothetical protein NESM_000664000 [Novymonas esmeraldas]|uniref:Uncharacterized protein n=1 Tax=Novymonas esmeraldas TaxID=1808958 RepID=A0AAW0EVM1_9TRYP
MWPVKCCGDVPAVRRFFLDELVDNPAALEEVVSSCLGASVVQALIGVIINAMELKQVEERPDRRHHPPAHTRRPPTGPPRADQTATAACAACAGRECGLPVDRTTAALSTPSSCVRSAAVSTALPCSDRAASTTRPAHVVRNSSTSVLAGTGGLPHARPRAPPLRHTAGIAYERKERRE